MARVSTTTPAEFIAEAVKAAFNGVPVPIHTVDVPECLRIIQAHQIDMMIYPSMKKSFAHDHPLMQVLQKRVLTKTRWYLKLRHVLEYVHTLFEKEAIPYVNLKGVMLNDLLYTNSCRRNIRDIDLLVSPDLIEKAKACLSANGFEFKVQLSEEYCFIHTEHGIYLEVHTDLILMKGLSDQLQQYPSHILDADTHFVYLCAHAAKHNWQNLQWLIDIGMFYQKIPLNWTRVSEIGQHYHIRRSVLEGLCLIQEWFDLKTPAFPSTFADRLAISFRLWFAHYNWACVARNKPYDGAARPLFRALARVALVSSWSGKWEQFFFRLFARIKRLF